MRCMLILIHKPMIPIYFSNTTIHYFCWSTICRSCSNINSSTLPDFECLYSTENIQLQYFSEPLRQVLETLLSWDVTHYLDDFFIVFPSDGDISRPLEQFDQILPNFGLQKAAQKGSCCCIVSLLRFEFDSVKIQVTLRANKKEHAFVRLKF